MTSSRFQNFTTVASPWLIAGAAFATRLGFLYYEQHVIAHQVLAQVPFDQEAGNIALALSQGHGFSNLFRQATGATAWLPPVYPSLLSLIFRSFGAFTFASFIAAALLNCLVSASTTFPLFHLAHRIGGRRVALASSCIWVFLPSGILMPTEWIWDTSLSAFLATALAWATIRVAESTNLRAWLSYGLLWAFALLTNPSLGVALPILFAWAVLHTRKQSTFSWRVPALTFALIVICCVPWTARNFSNFHRLIPLRSNFAFELWIGNNNIFDPHAVGGRQRITRFEETRHYAELGETAYLSEKWDLASSFIRQKPALFMNLVGKRVVATWTGTEHPLDDFRSTDSRLVRGVIAVNLLLTLGTFAGIIALGRRRSPNLIPVAAFPILYPVVYYLTHTSLRYRHPIDPLLMLLSVYSAAAIFSVRRRTATVAPPT